MSQDRNPYYDSVRHKADRSEFASLRAGLEPRRRPAADARSPWLAIALAIGVLVVVAALVRHYLA